MVPQRIIKGVAVAPGLALGPVHVVRAALNNVPTWTVGEEQLARERLRLLEAIDQADEELRRRHRLVSQQSGDKDAEIFSFHRHMLADPGLRQRVEATIKDDRINAEAAVEQLIQGLMAKVSGLEGDNVRNYASDFADPWRLVLDMLMSHEREGLIGGGEKVVLAAAELTPQVATFLEREQIAGIITETGGRFSHGAVLARSFGIPCVVGLPNLLSRLEQGMRVSVDGDRGSVQLRPESDDVNEFLARVERRRAREKALALHASLPSVTSDGHSFGVLANIESMRDFDTFDVLHTDGVGLLRTEFLYMERNQFPSEEEQYRMYRRALENLGGRWMTLRTLDIGNDKQLPYFKMPKESNPALGWRGLRISLQWPDLMRVQLRAAMRASAHGNLRLLLPMVTSMEEVREVHRVFDDVRRQLVDQGYEVKPDIPVGIMLEVPSSVLALESLIHEVDFVSVGTNDLVQYLLAADRDNARVARLYDPLHPGVLAALAHVAKVARAAGKPASVCGEMAGDYASAIMLLGMGYHSVSVAPNFLNEIRYAVRRTSLVEAQEVANRARQQSCCEDVRRVLAGVRERLHERQLGSNLSGVQLSSGDSDLGSSSKNRENA